MRQAFKVFTILCTALILTNCSGKGVQTNRSNMHENKQPYGSVFGEDGITLLGKKKKNHQHGPGVEVNSYLWRASLDTVAFMPIASADPFGGLIITDWYTPAQSPNEKFKLNVYIMDRQLRSDGVKVTAFKKVYRKNKGWVDSPTSKEMSRKLEDKILTRARELRIKNRNND